MTFYRHFCEQVDFEPAVVTIQPEVVALHYKSLVLKSSRIVERLARTRLSGWIHGLRHRLGGRRIPREVHRFVDQVQPQAVFTVAGAWSWQARLAERVATSYQLPLVGSFNDWWNYNQIYHPSFEKTLASQFQRFYQRCDLAICTCEGMQEALGPHRNSLVLYPTGAEFRPTGQFTPVSDGPFCVGFGGNLGDWYGQMIEALVCATEAFCQSNIKFQIYGSRPSWSQEFGARMTASGFYHGQVDFPALTQAMKNCQVLLLPMGFDPAIRQIESTSFKTKFLDYLTFEKPILVWGPDYCSAVRTAREFDSAEVCTNPDPAAAAALLQRLKSDPDRQRQLVANALAMYEDRFHPERLHNQLVSRIKGLL